MRQFISSDEDPERDAVAARAPEGAEQQILDPRREVEGLRQALQTRPMIDVALGTVMATEGCTLDQAWQVLVNASQRTNTKLRTLALRLPESPANPGSPVPLRTAPPASAGGEEAGEQGVTEVGAARIASAGCAKPAPLDAVTRHPPAGKYRGAGGPLVMLNAPHGEQQRPSLQAHGSLRNALDGLNPQKR